MSLEYLLSGHAQKRLKQRLKIKNVRRAQNQMELAYQKGKIVKRLCTENILYILFNNAIYIFKIIINTIYKSVLLVTVFKDINKQYENF